MSSCQPLQLLPRQRFACVYADAEPDGVPEVDLGVDVTSQSCQAVELELDRPTVPVTCARVRTEGRRQSNAGRDSESGRAGSGRVGDEPAWCRRGRQRGVEHLGCQRWKVTSKSDQSRLRVG